MNNQHSSRDIAAVLRERISLARPDSEEIIYETKLAEEFGVSRTPIRQALQHLAYERMVTTKAGVGTTVVPLKRDSRRKDILAASSILNAAAVTAGDQSLLPHSAMVFSGHLGALSMVDEFDPSQYFRIRSQILHSISELIQNDILSDAFRASYWRLVRWRVEAFAQNPETELSKLKSQLMTAFKITRNNSVAELLAEISVSEVEWDNTNETGA